MALGSFILQKEVISRKIKVRSTFNPSSSLKGGIFVVNTPDCSVQRSLEEISYVRYSEVIKFLVLKIARQWEKNEEKIAILILKIQGN